MALTRAALREMGVTEKEQLDAIMEAHGASIEAAKEKATTTAETAAQRKIDELQAKVDSLPAGDLQEIQAQLEAEKTAHNATKTKLDDEINKTTTSTKRSAVHQALKELGAHDEDLKNFLVDKVLNEIGADKVELDGDKVKDPKAFEGYKEQYKRYFGDTVTVGAGVATPPKGDGGNAYAAQYAEARKAGNNADAIAIKLQAQQEGIIIN